MPNVLFPTGRVVTTPGALAAMQETNTDGLALLTRHVTGDFGDVDDDDKKENLLSIKKGFRVMSAYHLTDGTKVWLITEADRSVTTFLLPSEY